MVDECGYDENGIWVCNDPKCYGRRIVTEAMIQLLREKISHWPDSIEKERNEDLLDEINKRNERIIRRLEGSNERIHLNRFPESRENLRLTDSTNTESESVEDVSSTSSSSLPQEPLAALSDLMADLILTSDTEKLNTERLTKIALANQKMLTCLLEIQQTQNAGNDLSSESFSILSNHLYSLLVEIFDDSTSGVSSQ